MEQILKNAFVFGELDQNSCESTRKSEVCKWINNRLLKSAHEKRRHIFFWIKKVDQNIPR